MGIIATVLFVSAAMLQTGSDWQEVVVSSTGTRYLIRKSDVANEVEMNPTFWAMLDYSADKTERNRSAKRRYAVDCTAGTYQILSSIEYDARGVVVDNESHPANRYSHKAIVPETVGEGLAKAVCPTGKYGG